MYDTMGKPCVTPNADWCHVFADVALIQILCHQLLGWHGRVRPPSLALPNGKLREPGMRCMIHLLLSCGRLMRTHRLLTHEFLAQFQEDQRYEAETEAKHTSIFGSALNPMTLQKKRNITLAYRMTNGTAQILALNIERNRKHCSSTSRK